MSETEKELLERLIAAYEEVGRLRQELANLRALQPMFIPVPANPIPLPLAPLQPQSPFYVSTVMPWVPNGPAWDGRAPNIIIGDIPLPTDWTKIPGATLDAALPTTFH
jgi:hypothetical protein